MDLQAQEGLLSTWREGWRTRNVVATILALALVAFYVVLYFGGSTHFGVAIPDVFQPLASKLHLKSKWRVNPLMLLWSRWYRPCVWCSVI